MWGGIRHPWGMRPLSFANRALDVEVVELLLLRDGPVAWSGDTFSRLVFEFTVADRKRHESEAVTCILLGEQARETCPPRRPTGTRAQGAPGAG